MLTDFFKSLLSFYCKFVACLYRVNMPMTENKLTTICVIVVNKKIYDKL